MKDFKVIPMKFSTITQNAVGEPERSFLYGKAQDGQVIIDIVEHHANTDLTVSYKSFRWNKVYEVPRDQLEIKTPRDVLLDLEGSGTFTYLEMSEGGVDE